MKKLIVFLSIVMFAITAFSQLPECSGCADLAAPNGRANLVIGEWYTYTAPDDCSGLYLHWTIGGGINGKNLTATTIDLQRPDCGTTAWVQYDFSDTPNRLDATCITWSAKKYIQAMIEKPDQATVNTSPPVDTQFTYSSSSVPHGDSYQWRITGGDYSGYSTTTSINLTFEDASTTYEVKIRAKNDDCYDSQWSTILYVVTD